ncbi:MAG TPA: TolC family protein [Candidatus Saccharicenans sp.]|nr:TolC family protein [Candidatus Saccharicenans sp.]HQO75215.1 TolC family protein [Candidatus Saccharicenans sp.]HUM78405.1 TolC family protein [Candidatus Saccharicenans sp.]
MKKVIRMVGVLLGLLLAGTWLMQAQEEQPLKLTLEDCILQTIQNNLGVSVQKLNPEISAAALSRSKEKFYPTMQFGYTRRSNINPSYSGLEAVESYETDYNDVNGQISQFIPFGGTLNISLDTYKSSTTQNYQTWNPRYYSTLRFDFSQPLLQNFGLDISKKEIIIARKGLESSLAQTELAMMNTIYSAEQAYWNLVYAIEDLKVKQESLKLARELLAKNQKSVEIGTLAPLDVLSAQSEVATREADIIRAEAAVKNAEDQLWIMMNISDEEKKQYTSIEPFDLPKIEQKAMSLEEAESLALESRPDLRNLRVSADTQLFNLKVAKNQLLPALNLVASYYSPGLSGNRLVYQDNNPLTGIVVDVIPGPRSQSLKDSFRFKYNNWSVGLTLNIPLGNAISRAGVAQARLNLQQAELNLQQQEQQAKLEVKTALRTVEANLHGVEAYKTARILQEQKLAAEEEKLKVGQSTNYTVLQYQRDLSAARSSELKAIIDYNISVANLDKILGISLKNRNIKLMDMEGSN